VGTAPVAVEDPPEYGITVIVLKCPNRICRSLNIELYKTCPWIELKRKKYYRCKCCGYRFRVTEVNKD
jgi:hypothetical protein